MHIPVGRARCHAQSPSSQEQKQTELILFHVDVAEWKQRVVISVCGVNILYLIKSSIKCSDHGLKKYFIPSIWITIEAIVRGAASSLHYLPCLVWDTTSLFT